VCACHQKIPSLMTRFLLIAFPFFYKRPFHLFCISLFLSVDLYNYTVLFGSRGRLEARSFLRGRSAQGPAQADSALVSLLIGAPCQAPTNTHNLHCPPSYSAGLQSWGTKGE